MKVYFEIQTFQTHLKHFQNISVLDFAHTIKILERKKREKKEHKTDLINSVDNYFTLVC